MEEDEVKRDKPKKEPSAIENAISNMMKETSTDEDGNPQKIIKRIPITEEMKPRIREFQNPLSKLHKEFCRLNSIRKKFWAEFELETETYDKHMKINSKEGVIEVYEGIVSAEELFSDTDEI